MLRTSEYSNRLLLAGTQNARDARCGDARPLLRLRPERKRGLALLLSQTIFAYAQILLADIIVYTFTLPFTLQSEQ